MSEPKWMTLARADLGTKEIPGAKHNPKILAYYRDAHNPGINNDETAWCAAFVGAILERCGIVSTRKLNARSYLDWGQKVTEPQIGDIVVFARGNDGWSGHVGFYAGKGPGATIMLLGGNQGVGVVSLIQYGTGRLLGYRRPIGVPKAPEVKVDAVFDRALKIIGPSAEDLTIEEFSIFQKKKLTPENRGEIRAARNSADTATVRKLFWQNYWVPAGCESYPADQAIMVFLTAVHHDANVARKLTQEAVGAKADGIVGPKTIEAVKNSKASDFVQKLAELSIALLRQKTDYDIHQARWLKDINDTATALTGKAVVKVPTPKPSVAAPAASGSPSTAKSEVKAMTDTPAASAAPAPAPVPAPKAWHQSLTIWGTIVTFASTVLPVLGPLVGIDISASEVQTVGSSVTAVIQAVGGVVGTLMAIYGRTKVAPITLK